jgi:hypothetical protein
VTATYLTNLGDSGPFFFIKLNTHLFLWYWSLNSGPCRKCSNTWTTPPAQINFFCCTPSSFPFSGSTGNWTQDLVLAKQLSVTWAMLPELLLISVFEYTKMLPFWPSWFLFHLLEMFFPSDLHPMV